MPGYLIPVFATPALPVPQLRSLCPREHILGEGDVPSALFGLMVIDELLHSAANRRVIDLATKLKKLGYSRVPQEGGRRFQVEFFTSIPRHHVSLAGITPHHFLPSAGRFYYDL